MGLVACPDCGETNSEHVDSCRGCGCPRSYLEPVVTESADCYFAGRYLRYRRPLLQILVLTAALSLASVLISRLSGHAFTAPQWFFLVYANLFLAFWVSYFTSRKPPGREGHLSPLQSLRRLLGETAAHWPAVDCQDGNSRRQLVAAFRRKADSSIQLLAIMIAISILILDRVTTIIDGLQVASSSFEPDFAFLMLSVSGVAAIVSFVCFVVSVDALDVVFNKFDRVQTGQTVVRHYYQSTINPKYYGLLSMLIGVICLAAYYHFYIGALAIGIALAVGYFHWFPDFSRDAVAGAGKLRLFSWVGAERVFQVVIVSIPAVLWLHDRFSV